MDAKMYAEAVEYEKFTQSVYQAIMRKENVGNVNVEHNLDIKGRSGVAHQIDVSWRFRRATVEHHVLIECKNYASDITLEKVRNFFAVLHDIGNCQGIMVTKTGYQKGVVDFAKHYGIGLKLLRKPIAEDWKGRIKDIQINIKAIGLASTLEKAPRVGMFFPANTPQAIKDALEKGELTFAQGPDTVFLNDRGEPIIEEFRYWIPKSVVDIGKGAGGPYTKAIPLSDHYIRCVDKTGAPQLVKVEGVTITYHLEEFDVSEVVIAGEEVVDAILKDFNSGEVEHVARKAG
jgi:hypothetical protein